MSRFTKERNFLARPMLGAVLFAILATSCSDGEQPARRKPLPARQDFATEALRVRKTVGADFLVEVAEPFIAAGNLSRAEFDRILNGTILNCYQAFYRQFFTVKPDYVIKVYLFKDDATYREYARKLFGDKPSTPFGYYKSENHSLIMNIATGTGTLVHEMTHALIEPDFPQVPAWFNEGLGSLFEQCIVTPHGLKGLVNWRLPILREAISERRLTGLRKLISTTSAQFYRDERRTHYAEARYFCMYMQEIGLLEKFYKNFRADFRQDPTGAKMIEKLFSKSLEEIQRDWIEWVGKLPRYGVSR